MYDSPFVRRVAITMRIYGLEYEHLKWSVFGDFEKIRGINPLGRVPVLLVDDQPLIESSAIIDYLDSRVQPACRLTPGDEPGRHQALFQTMVAMGLAEKAVALFYETAKREQRYQDPDWAARLRHQLHSALDWLESEVASWPAERFDQAAITAAVVTRFVIEYLPESVADRDDVALSRLSQRLEATTPFKAVPFGE